MEKVFFHVDMDAFYASVEQKDNPAYRGKPVIIGALPGHRGVVSACSYEARKYGIRSAMPVSEAFRLCPKGTFLPVRMDRYQNISHQIMRVLGDYSPEIHQISIDEAFLDMTGTERLFGPKKKAALTIKQNILDTFGLTISVGVAENMFLAKMASEYKKPDGLYIVEPGKECVFLDSVALKDIWGLGKKTLERLEELNITTVPELRGYPLPVLRKMLGKCTGEYLYGAVRGDDPGLFGGQPKSHTISNERTFEHDTRDFEGLKMVLLDLAHQVMFRAQEQGVSGKTVTIKVRFSDFSTTTAQKSLRHSILSANEIYHIAVSLLEKRWNTGTPVRLIGVGLSGMETKGSPRQIDLFTDEYDKRKKVEEAVFGIRQKHRETPIMKASLLGKINNAKKQKEKDGTVQ